jgi:hypothetical protein
MAVHSNAAIVYLPCRALWSEASVLEIKWRRVVFEYYCNIEMAVSVSVEFPCYNEIFSMRLEVSMS